MNSLTDHTWNRSSRTHDIARGPRAALLTGPRTPWREGEPRTSPEVSMAAYLGPDPALFVPPCSTAPTHIDEVLADVTLEWPARRPSRHTFARRRRCRLFCVLISSAGGTFRRWRAMGIKLVVSGLCFLCPSAPCLMIMRGEKARGEGWGQYANSGCTL